MTHFRRHWLLVNMPITKFLVKNLLIRKSYNAKQLVREFTEKGTNVGKVYKNVAKATGVRVTGSVVPAMADDALSAQLITLILFTNWCYTKMASREIIFHTVSINTTLLSTKNIKTV